MAVHLWLQRIIRFLGTLCFLTVSVVAVQPGSVQAANRPAGVSIASISTGASAEKKILKNLLDAVLRFRQIGLQDHREALSKFGTKAAIRKFDQLSESIFPATDATNSWSFFFNTSVYALGSSARPRYVAAFYHPWSDVFLLMDWEERNGRFWLTDAEIVVGDCMRGEPLVEGNPTPAWLRKGTFGPLSLGISVGEAIASFEGRFAKRSYQGFREALPFLNARHPQGEENDRLAASRLLYAMMKIEALGERLENDEVLFSLWTETYRAVDQAAEGDWEGLFQRAGKTLVTTRHFLKKIPPDTFRNLVIADYHIQERGWLVFLVPAFDAGYCLSLSFEPDGHEQMQVKRIDFISFPIFYDHYVKKGKKS